MTRSMTGFSTVSGGTNSTNYVIQLRSENSKNLDISIHDEFNNFKLQEKIKVITKKNFTRGKIRISIDYHRKELLSDKKLQKTLSHFNNVAKKFNLKPNISLSELTEIINKETIKEESSNKSIDFQIKLFKKGLKELIKSQEYEGRNLISDITNKLNKIEKLKNKIIKESKNYMARLNKKYSDEIRGALPNIDTQEIRREINSAIEKIDIEEEIIRLDSHVSEIKKIIKKTDQKGQIIDFYMQEINREANTISSKSKNPKLSDMAIEIKSHLNQIREIAANLS